MLTRRTRDGDVLLLRLLALWSWSYVIWMLLLWTLTAEVLGTGVVVCVVLAIALSWTGPVAGPWFHSPAQSVISAGSWPPTRTCARMRSRSCS